MTATQSNLAPRVSNNRGHGDARHPRNARYDTLSCFGASAAVRHCADGQVAKCFLLERSCKLAVELSVSLLFSVALLVSVGPLAAVAHVAWQLSEERKIRGEE